MRSARIIGHPPSVYHAISRVIEGRFLLNDQEKERLVTLIHKVAAFSGAKVLAYAVLDSHYHLVLQVPPARKLSMEQVLDRIACLYKEEECRTIRSQIEQFQRLDCQSAVEELLKRFTCRMYDLSEHMKTLNQRCSQSYNLRHNRHGTLWLDRFNSVLLEGKQGLTRLVAAYVEVNAVRAGLVEDPKDYRFCSYGAAMGGQKHAREGIAKLMGMAEEPWKVVRSEYRKLLYIYGVKRNNGKRRNGFDWEEVQKVLDAGGELSLPQLLRCRVRYFSSGLVLGSKPFVKKVIKQNSHKIKLKRGARAHQVAATALDAYYHLRPMRGEDAISVPKASSGLITA